VSRQTAGAIHYQWIVLSANPIGLKKVSSGKEEKKEQETSSCLGQRAFPFFPVFLLHLPFFSGSAQLTLAAWRG